MYINYLTLKNYRSYQNKTFIFKPGINIISGDNGSGKTNIIEAIYYLSIFKSFRSKDNLELIFNNSPNAYIEASVKIGDINKTIKILISKDKKNILVNNKPIRKLKDLAKDINIILFEPRDVFLFKGQPKERRDFLNISISKKSGEYLDLLSKYEKILNDRNLALKQEKVDLNLIDTYTELIINLEERIINYRRNYLKDINDILIKITRVLASTHTYKGIKIIYKPFIEYSNDFKIKAKQAYKNSLEYDLKTKTTNIGVHREDFTLKIDDKDIATHYSQGENRMFAISLKLAPYFLIEDKDKKPIVLLDDIMSELDIVHQNKLIQFLQKFVQVFITSTKLNIKNANHYKINKKEDQ